jgi:hypothetical protein
MKIQDFEYTKADGSISNRKVMVMREGDDFIEAIDFKYLNNEEENELIKIQNEYEAILRPLTEKALRRFKTSRMAKFHEIIV